MGEASGWCETLEVMHHPRFIDWYTGLFFSRKVLLDAHRRVGWFW